MGCKCGFTPSRIPARAIYRTLSQFKEFEDSLAPHEKHGVHYTIKAVNIMDHIYVLFRIISEDSVATC